MNPMLANIIAVLSGLLGLVIAYKTFNLDEDKVLGMNKNLMYIPAILLLGVGLAQFGVLEQVGISSFLAVTPETPAAVTPETPAAVTPETPAAVTPETPKTGVYTANPCPSTTSITGTFGTHNAYQSGTEAAGNYPHRVFESSKTGTWVDRGFVAEGGTLSLSPTIKYDDGSYDYNTLRILFRFNESANNAYNLTYAKMVTDTLGCTDKPYDEAVYDTSTTPSISVRRKDGELMTASVQEDVSASSEYAWKVRVMASNDQCIGNPNAPGKGNIMCWAYNTTTSTGFEMSTVGTPSVPLTSVTTPTSLSTTSGKLYSCFYTPDVLCDNAEKTYNVLFKSASTAPSDTSDDSVYIIDTTIDLDKDYLFAVPIIYSYQDEDNNDLGISATPSGIYYVT